MGTKILTAEGLEVVTVSNGEAALKRIQKNDIDLVLADVYMPGHDGYEICQWVKKSQEYGGIPVVLVVGGMEVFEPEKIGDVKSDGLLTKPFEATAMMEVLRPIVDNIRNKLSMEAMKKAAATPADTPVTERTLRLTPDDRSAIADVPPPPPPPVEFPHVEPDVPLMMDEAPPAPAPEPAPAAPEMTSGSTTEMVIPDIPEPEPPRVADLPVEEAAPPPVPEPPPPPPPPPPATKWVAEAAEVTEEDREKHGEKPAAKSETPPDWGALLKSVEEKEPPVPAPKPPSAQSSDFELDLAEEAPAAASAAPAPKVDEDTIRQAVQLCLENALPNLVDEITSSILRRLGKPS